jgi:cold shock CspA family protein
MRGRVDEFDEAAGLGVIIDGDGRAYPFHCIEIADGTRTIDTDQAVVFELLPRLGRLQAGAVQKI